MALETGTYISDLVSTNPVSSDNISQGDDHIRLLKATIKATFPNVSGAVTPTHTELNYVDGVTSAIQTQLDAKAANGANSDITSVYLNNTGLKLKDTNASHGLIIAPGSDLTLDRTLTLTTGDADRTLTISGNATISQDYSSTGNPQFATIELGAASDTTISRVSAGVIAIEGVAVPLNSVTSTHTAQQIELGHASDTTITRVSAGVIAVEGATIATLASPAFTGTPTAPSAAGYADSTQIATTAQVYDTVTTVPENAQTGTSYTLALADAGKLVTLSNAAAITLTIPTNASVAFPTNTRIDIIQYGAGQVTVGGAGVTIRSSGSKLKLSGQYSGATLWKKGTDEWVLIGDIVS